MKTPVEDDKGKAPMKMPEEHDQGKSPEKASEVEDADGRRIEDTKGMDNQIKRAMHSSRKASVMAKLHVGDFVAIKIHKICRTQGNRTGKSVPKIEGPYIIEAFTDDTERVT